MIVRLSRCRPSCFRHFRPQPREFCVQRVLVRQQSGQLFVLVTQLRPQLLQLLQRLPGNRSRLRQQGRIKRQPGCRTALAPIRMSKPVAHMKQLPDCDNGIAVRNWSMLMHRPIAQRHNHLRLVEHCITGDLFERRFMDQRRDIVLIR